MDLISKVDAYVNKLAAIGKEEVAHLVAHGRARKVKKGELFLREGDICNEVMFVERGVFRYFVTKEGADFTKDFCLDSSNPFCTGFASFVTHSPSLINIEALENSEVIVWQGGYIQNLFATMPWSAFARRIAELLFVRKERREISLLKDSAEERYRLFVSEYKDVMQRVPQYHIASYLSITPESLSRIRRSLAGRA